MLSKDFIIANSTYIGRRVINLFKLGYGIEGALRTISSEVDVDLQDLAHCWNTAEEFQEYRDWAPVEVWRGREDNKLARLLVLGIAQNKTIEDIYPNIVIEGKSPESIRARLYEIANCFDIRPEKFIHRRLK